MKKIVFSALFVLISFSAISQTFPVSGDITTTDGVGINIASIYLQAMAGRNQSKYVRINTKIPFADQKGMTSLYIDYWGYNRAWRTRVGWYVYQGGFYSPSISISGQYEHTKVVLSNIGGFVSISVPVSAFSHYGHMTVNSMTEHVNSIPSTWMDGWTFNVEVAPGGSHQVTPEIGNMLTTDGNIGVGTNTPNRKLEINGDNAYIRLLSESGGIAGIELREEGGVNWSLRSAGTNNSLNLSNTAGIQLSLTEGGDIGLGNAVMGTSQITINGDALVTSDAIIEGNIEAKRLKVTQSPGNWPDYVFQPTFRLRPLSEVEAFVNTNKHLPEVPSAIEVQKSGLDVGDMSAILLKKIEELTLYTIDQEKRIKEQNKVIKELLKRLEKLEKN